DKTAASHWVSIGGHQEQTVEGHSELQAGQAIRQRTKAYEVQASESLILKGPGGTIRIDGSGITLDGVAILIKGPMSQKGGGGNNRLSLFSEALEGLDADCAERNR
ncbi:Rhs element Vgr protein, partial [Achromobacter spanius]